MIKGIDVSQRVEYTFPHDTDEVKTVFVFRPLTSIEMMDLVSDGEGQEVKLKGKDIFKYLELSIAEIRNFPITDVKQALPTLKIGDLTLLVKEMDRINKMSAGEAGNS